MAAKGILERLSEGVVLGDGGYIIELEQRGIRGDRGVHAGVGHHSHPTLFASFTGR